MSNECYLCLRIDPEQFFQELRKYGFYSGEARRIVSWIKKIYEKDPTFLCGRRSSTIKASLAYIGARLLTNKRGREMYKFSQRDLALHFKCTETALRSNYQRIMKTFGYGSRFLRMGGD